MKARHQSGLPLGYTLLDYIQSGGSQYIDTLRVPNNNDIIEQKFKKNGTNTATCSWYGSMPSSSEITPRIGVGSFYSQSVLKLFAGSNYTGLLADANAQVHTLRFQATGRQELTYTLDGVTSVIDASSASTPIDMYEPAIELTSYLFARHGTNGVQVYDNEGTRIYYHREYLANGTLVLDMVPVKRSDNVLGMYDLVSGQFFTNQGTGTFTAGNPVTDPVEIYTDGTVETIEDTIGNTATTEMLLKVGDYQDVQSIIDGVVTRNVGVKVLNGTENWSSYQGGICWTSANLFPGKVSGNAQSYCTHYAWTSSGTSGMTNNQFLLAGTARICIKDDRFQTNTDFAQFLADQYASGTPVIVLYPLATPTTESVTGQTLQVTDGDNVLEITQASLSNLELEAKYKKEA